MEFISETRSITCRLCSGEKDTRLRPDVSGNLVHNSLPAFKSLSTTWSGRTGGVIFNACCLSCTEKQQKQLWVTYGWSARGVNGVDFHSLTNRGENGKGGRRVNNVINVSLFVGLNLARLYSPSHKPGLSVSFIKICRSKKGPARLLGSREITWWGLGITHMNKLWVGICYYEADVCPYGWREQKLLPLTHSRSPSLYSRLHHTSNLFPLLHLFLPFLCFIFMLQHGNVISCLLSGYTMFFIPATEVGWGPSLDAFLLLLW